MEGRSVVSPSRCLKVFGFRLAVRIRMVVRADEYLRRMLAMLRNEEYKAEN